MNTAAGRVQSLVIHAFFWIFTASSLLPFLLVVMASFTDEKTISQNGYSFFPEKVSVAAYQFLVNDSASILKAYGVTILTTVLGTVISVFLTALYAYPISKADMPFRRTLSFYIFFTMLFGGGLVPWYIVYSQYFNIKDTLFALIVPNLLMGAFNVLMMRSFFANSIPESVLESATIDGAGEFRLFFQMVVPMSLPVFATVGLFNTLAYWNDWFNCMIFNDNANLYNLQYLMSKTLTNIQFLMMKADSSKAAELLSMMPTETVRMAMAIIGMGPIILAYPFFQRFYIQGITVGAVKG
ncbi:carbohydrate ABC transporter permease [Paenibacillus sp. GCM10027628]|uniref:carbohydrate ABC transporter permease n=1 Tax=Paenibacillus sp. GCM10027628 TaxID=3273413 RepID=UPI00362528BE